MISKCTTLISYLLIKFDWLQNLASTNPFTIRTILFCPLVDPHTGHFVCGKFLADNNDCTSDHFWLMINFNTTLHNLYLKNNVINRKIDIEAFSDRIDKNLNLNPSLQNSSDINNAIDNFINFIQQAAFVYSQKFC